MYDHEFCTKSAIYIYIYLPWDIILYRNWECSFNFESQEKKWNKWDANRSEHYQKHNVERHMGAYEEDNCNWERLPKLELCKSSFLLKITNFRDGGHFWVLSNDIKNKKREKEIHIWLTIQLEKKEKRTQLQPLTTWLWL